MSAVALNQDQTIVDLSTAIDNALPEKKSVTVVVHYSAEMQENQRITREASKLSYQNELQRAADHGSKLGRKMARLNLTAGIPQDPAEFHSWAFSSES